MLDPCGVTASRASLRPLKIAKRVDFASLDESKVGAYLSSKYSDPFANIQIPRLLEYNS